MQAHGKSGLPPSKQVLHLPSWMEQLSSHIHCLGSSCPGSLTVGLQAESRAALAFGVQQLGY